MSKGHQLAKNRISAPGPFDRLTAPMVLKLSAPTRVFDLPTAQGNIGVFAAPEAIELRQSWFCSEGHPRLDKTGLVTYNTHVVLPYPGFCSYESLSSTNCPVPHV